MNEYALYRGDTFIDLGTITYLAKKHRVKKHTMMYLATPCAHRKAHGSNKRMLLYKIEDD